MEMAHVRLFSIAFASLLALVFSSSSAQSATTPAPAATTPKPPAPTSTAIISAAVVATASDLANGLRFRSDLAPRL